MRAITHKIIQSFIEGKSKIIGNTITDGRSVFLHNKEIIKKANGQVWITTANWNTATTKERLRGLGPNIVRVGTSKGKLFLNGREWNGDWIEVANIRFDGTFEPIE